MFELKTKFTNQELLAVSAEQKVDLIRWGRKSLIVGNKSGITSSTCNGHGVHFFVLDKILSGEIDPQKTFVLCFGHLIYLEILPEEGRYDYVRMPQCGCGPSKGPTLHQMFNPEPFPLMMASQIERI